MDFAIVHFQTENSVAVVPSIWIAGESNLCYWPPYRASRLETAVKERERNQQLTGSVLLMCVCCIFMVVKNFFLYLI